MPRISNTCSSCWTTVRPTCRWVKVVDRIRPSPVPGYYLLMGSSLGFLEYSYRALDPSINYGHLLVMAHKMSPLRDFNWKPSWRGSIGDNNNNNIPGFYDQLLCRVLKKEESLNSSPSTQSESPRPINIILYILTVPLKVASAGFRDCGGGTEASGNGIGNCEAFGKCELIRLECEHRDPVSPLCSSSTLLWCRKRSFLPL